MFSQSEFDSNSVRAPPLLILAPTLHSNKRTKLSGDQRVKITACSVRRKPASLGRVATTGRRRMTPFNSGAGHNVWDTASFFFNSLLGFESRGFSFSPHSVSIRIPLKMVDLLVNCG
jgi:hypothetical protein